MKKLESHYVLIDSKKQAEQYKYILTAAGIDTSNFVIDDYDRGCREIGYSSRGGFWLSGGYSIESNYEKVSIGQLIDLLNEPKKIAVRVENEKEFKALMKYYDSLGWTSQNRYKLQYSHKLGKNETITFHDEFFANPIPSENYQIIPFSDFAAEHNIKLPLLTSEDGVDLYEGDDYHEASYYGGGNVWQYVHGPSHRLKTNHRVYENREKNKAFSTQQAALSWIEAQKPKEIIYNVPESKFTIKIQNNRVSGFDGLAYLDLKDMQYIIKKMQELQS